MKIAVSILKSKYSEKETIERINETNAAYIHLDVMDGKFVLEKTKEFEYLNVASKKIQVHLMVSNPFYYINKYNLPNVETIIIQSELGEDIGGLLDYIRGLGKRAGLAIKPETNVDSIMPYLDLIDDVLVLTVHPGKGGQSILMDAIPKIDELKKIKEQNNYNFEITVDGGVNDKTIKLVTSADIAVVGSFICMNDDYNVQIDKLFKF